MLRPWRTDSYYSCGWRFSRNDRRKVSFVGGAGLLTIHHRLHQQFQNLKLVGSHSDKTIVHSHYWEFLYVIDSSVWKFQLVTTNPLRRYFNFSQKTFHSISTWVNWNLTNGHRAKNWRLTSSWRYGRQRGVRSWFKVYNNTATILHSDNFYLDCWCLVERHHHIVVTSQARKHNCSYQCCYFASRGVRTVVKINSSTNHWTTFSIQSECGSAEIQFYFCGLESAGDDFTTNPLHRYTEHSYDLYQQCLCFISCGTLSGQVRFALHMNAQIVMVKCKGKHLNNPGTKHRLALNAEGYPQQCICTTGYNNTGSNQIE